MTTESDLPTLWQITTELGVKWVFFCRSFGLVLNLFSSKHEIYVLMDTGLRFDGPLHDRLHDWSESEETEDQETSPPF
jgi:hypothetical protein